MTKNNTDILAQAAMNPLLRNMPAPRARDILKGRMTALIVDVMIEGDEKAPELVTAIRNIDAMPGCIALQQIDSSARRLIAEALCNCGTPAGFHTKGCAGLE